MDDAAGGQGWVVAVPGVKITPGSFAPIHGVARLVTSDTKVRAGAGVGGRGRGVVSHLWI